MGMRTFLSRRVGSLLVGKHERPVPAAVRRAAFTSVELLEGRRLLSATILKDGGDDESDDDNSGGGIVIAPWLDFVGPSADVSVGDVTAAIDGTLNVAVRYEDAASVVNATLVGTEDAFLVYADGTRVAATAGSILPDGSDDSGRKLMALYSFPTPGGGWDSADNGEYAIEVVGGAVADTLGNLSSPARKAFHVEIEPPAPPPPPVDETAPTAAVSVPATVIANGTVAVTVTYTDDTAIDATRIGKDDLEVKLRGKKKIEVESVATTVDPSGKSATAVYTLKAPGTGWDATDNGTVSVEVKKGAVADAAGNKVAAAEAAFEVAFVVEPPVVDPPVVDPPVVDPPVEPPVTPPAVAVPPAAGISPIDTVKAAGTKPNTVTVTYKDADGLIDASTVGIGDITVTGPGGAAVAVTGVSIAPQSNASKVTATYTIVAPGGSWDAADNGAYSVTVNADAVKDTAGNGVAAVTTAFNVNVPVPAPVIDSSFSGGAPVNVGFVAEASVGLPDGKLLLVGRQGDVLGGASQYVVKRLNADGSQDGSFGKGGVASSTFLENDAAYAVVVGSADGSIYIAGSKGTDLAVTKLKASGQLDGKFGTNGQLIVDLGGDNDRALGIAWSPDGGLVVVGASGAKNAIVKLSAKGDLDAGFGVNGVVVNAPTTGDSALSGVAVMADGRILAGGSIGNKVVVYRLLPNGFADATFGGNGVVVVPGLSSRTDLGSADSTVGVALQGDKVLVTGRVNGDFAVARLVDNGDLDVTFAGGGIAKIDLGGDDDADQIVVQASGQILVVGTSEQGTSARIGIAALTEDGAPDTSFGTGGTTSVDAGIDAGRALHAGTLVVRAFAAAQTNGQLVVGTGQTSPTPTPAGSGIRRLNVPGSGTLGTFGVVNGKNRNLSFIDNDGTKVTIKLKGGGTASAAYDGSNVVLTLKDTTDASVLSISTKGGDKLVNIATIKADHGLKAVKAKGAVVTGALVVNGNLGGVELRALKGLLSATGNIGSVKIGADVENAFILAGTSLGANNAFGGIGADTDTYGGGSIKSVKVGGAIRGSIVAAGILPEDGQPMVNDTVVNPATSKIGSFSAKRGIDAASEVVAGGIGKVSVPKLIKDPAADSRFTIDPA